MQIIFRICLDFFGQFAPMKIGGLSTTDDWFVLNFPKPAEGFLCPSASFCKASETQESHCAWGGDWYCDGRIGYIFPSILNNGPCSRIRAD